MSLINRMLQDLDSRGTESVGKGTMYAQIRSVPDLPKQSSLRWLWLILPLAGMAMVAMWFWMQHPLKSTQVINTPAKAPTAAELPVQASLMDLKLSSDLTVTQLQDLQPAPQNLPDNNRSGNAPFTDVTATPTSERKPVDDKIIIVDRQAELTSQSSNKVPVLSSAAVAPVAMSVTPKERVTPAAAKASDAVPAAINKQVNELTVQQRAENEYRKALLLIQQGKSGEAIGGLEQALQLDRTMVSARQTLAGLLIDAKRSDDAAQRLQDGLAVDPAQTGLAMILARLQVEKGDLRHALETLQRTLPYATDRADYQAFLAAVLQRDGKNKDAIEHYAAALRQNPQNGVWWMGLGISLQAENRLPEAREAFARAKSSNMLSAELQSFVDQKLDQLKR